MSYTWGNRCGHQKKWVRSYKRPSTQRRPPLIIIKATERLQSYFHKPRRYLKRLRELWINGRQKKSERREAHTVVLQVLVNYVDLGTFMVAIPTDKGTLNYCRINFIAKKTGFGHRRVQRAMRELEEAGYLEVKRSVKKEAPANYYQSCQIKIKECLFYDLLIKKEYVEMSYHYRRKSKKGAISPLKEVKVPDHIKKLSAEHAKKRLSQLLETSERPTSKNTVSGTYIAEKAKKALDAIPEALRGPLGRILERSKKNRKLSS